MQIFITGGTGLIGSYCIQQLSPSHTIRALSRSDAAAEKLKQLGATPVHGSVGDLELLEKESKDADAVIYCAFDHSSADRAASAKVEAKGIEAACKGLQGSNKVLIYCTGVAFFGPSDKADEFTPLPKSFRCASDEVVEKYASLGVRPVQLRVGLVVHEPGRIHPFVAALHQGTEVTYAKEGSNRWPVSHAADVARLVARVLEDDKIPEGKVSAVHAYTERISTRDLAEAIGQQSGLPVRGMGEEELKEKGAFMEFVLTASPDVKNNWTKETFGWDAKENTLLEDLKEGRWFVDA